MRCSFRSGFGEQGLRSLRSNEQQHRASKELQQQGTALCVSTHFQAFLIRVDFLDSRVKNLSKSITDDKHSRKGKTIGLPLLPLSQF
jgi:hypothetical protein